MTDAATISRSVDLMTLVNTQLRKSGNTEGGEYSGPCPFCGGNDRFSVQPNHPEGGRWYCRGFGDNKWHSPFDYVMRRDDIPFKEALMILGGDTNHSIPKQRQNAPGQAIDKRVIVRTCDSPEWQEQAIEIVSKGIADLWSSDGDRARAYLHKRGLTEKTIKLWDLGFIPEPRPGIAKGILIPCFEGGFGAGNIKYLRIRTSSQVKNEKWRQVSGSRSWLYGGFTYSRGAIAYLLESNFDVMLANQIGASGVGYAGIAAGDRMVIEFAKYFTTVDDLIIIPDNDEAGIRGATTRAKSSRYWHIANTAPEGSDLTGYYLASGNDDLTVSAWLGEQSNLIIKEGDQAHG